MAPADSADQRLLRDSARRFLDQRYDFAARRAHLAAARGSDAIWSEFADMGWLALPVAEKHGGLGGGLAEISILMECFGRALVVEPYVECLLLGANLLQRCASAGQCAALLPSVLGGRLQLAFAHGEDEREAQCCLGVTRAQPGQGGWTLSGRKSLVLIGSDDAMLLVSALIGPDNRLAVFLVPARAGGVRLTRYPLVDDRMAADIRFESVRLPADARLGEGDCAAAAVETVLDDARIALCADAVGVAGYLLDATVDYLRQRQQFGKPLASFQALQHRVADMAVAFEESRSALQMAVSMATVQIDGRARIVSSASVKCARAALQIAQQAVQLHGAMGVTEELAIGSYLKRAQTAGLILGSTDFHLRRYAAQAAASPGLRRAHLDAYLEA